MREHIGKDRLPLVSRVRDVNVLCIRDITHQLQIGLGGFTSTDVSLRRWWQLNELFDLIATGKGESSYHRLLRAERIARTVELVHHGLRSLKRDAGWQPYIDHHRLGF